MVEVKTKLSIEIKTKSKGGKTKQSVRITREAQRRQWKPHASIFFFFFWIWALTAVYGAETVMWPGWNLLDASWALNQQCRTAVEAALWKKTVWLCKLWLFIRPSDKEKTNTVVSSLLHNWRHIFTGCDTQVLMLPTFRNYLNMNF